MLDKTIEKEINKCSRCGLCLQNCPIYEITKNENNTSRGLICKLNGYKKGELKEKEIKKDFKICLMCEKCKTNCPPKINTTGIFAYKNACFSPSKFSQRIFLALKLLPIKFLYFINFFKKGKALGTGAKTLYFKGCIARAQHKTTFLDNLYYDAGFVCCGLPYLAGGDIKNYKKARIKNTKIIKKADKIIFDCASCKNCVENYETLSKKDKKKLVFFCENKSYKLKTNSKYYNKTVVFHKPCHMSKEESENIENILKNIKGISYKKLENFDSCCGFGGSYFIFHPIISTKIALKKALTIKKSNADLILTACPSCTLGLRFNQLISFNFKKTLELRDFIDSETEVI